MVTHDHWKDDQVASMRGKGKEHLKTHGATHPSEAWIQQHFLKLQAKYHAALEWRPTVQEELMLKAAEDGCDLSSQLPDVGQLPSLQLQCHLAVVEAHGHWVSQHLAETLCTPDTAFQLGQP